MHSAWNRDGSSFHRAIAHWLLVPISSEGVAVMDERGVDDVQARNSSGWPVAGAVLLLASLLVLIVTQVIAGAAWQDPPYDVTFNNISDLGNVFCQPWSDDQRYVCSPRHAVANGGFLAGGALLILGLIPLRPLWKRTRLGLASWLCLFGGGLLWLTVGYWPADVNEGMHLTAWLWLLLAQLGLLLSAAGLAPAVPRPLRWLAPVVGVLGIVTAFAFVGQQYFGLGRGIAERVTVYSVSAWLALLAVWVAWTWTTRPRRH
jgi:hypothetical membrane protein